MALVRSARAYATGLWWANEDPSLAWLQMVTALEIAGQTQQSSGRSAAEILAEAWPELWADLASAPQDVRLGVAKHLAGQVKATMAFKDFVVKYAPEPPEPRPGNDALGWEAMRDHAGVIYRHRSKALHDGKPFPLPMFGPPFVQPSGAVQEVPMSMNTAAAGAL